jgi:hypothetical protein
VTIDGLLVRDAHETGIWVTSTAHNVALRDNEATNVGIGFKIDGRYNLVSGNYAHDLHMVVNERGTDNSYGAIGVALGNSDNEIAYNSFVRCRAPSLEYGWDGGGVEIFGQVNNSFIHHNYVYGSEGFIEVGGGAARQTWVSNNLVVNSGRVIGIHTAGKYASQVEDFTFINNTVVDTRPDEVWEAFYIDGSARPNTLTLRNNIIFLNHVHLVVSAPVFTHDHNLYYLANPASQIGFDLGKGEKLADPAFVDLAGGDFHLRAGSPALATGSLQTGAPSSCPSPGAPAINLGVYDGLSSQDQQRCASLSTNDN